MITQNEVQTKIEQIVNLPKVHMKIKQLQTHFSSVQKSQEELSNQRIPVILQISDVDEFVNAISPNDSQKDLTVKTLKTGEDAQPDMKTLVLLPDGFPVPYARALLTLDQIEQMAGLDSVRSVEMDIRIQALD